MPIRLLPIRAHRWGRPRLVWLLLALPAALLAGGCRPGERPAPPRVQAQAPPQDRAVPAAVLPAPTATAAPKTAPLSSVTPIPKAAPKRAGQDTPLTVTLAAADSGRHLRVGSDVALTAFTTLPRGRSATLTLFYQWNRGRRTVFSFAQGSLCSASWFARAPGRYRFTATALDDRQQAAVSQSVEITVDGPATQARPQAAVPPAAMAPPSRPRAPRVAERPAAAGPPLYHVVAARFAYSRNADVLAAALQRNGYHAAARRIADGRGRIVYVVETGTYRRPGEVFDAVAKLLRSGYPAYFYTSH